MMDDRAVSTTLNYVLSLAIASLLVTGLLIAAGSFVEDQQEEVIRSEMKVIGQQVAADINRADRLTTAGTGPTTVVVNQSFPRRITGTGYLIELEPSDDELVLRSEDPEVRVTVRVETETPLAPSFANGGVVVVRKTGSNEIEITNG